MCEDPYVQLLKKTGYNVVRLPKADLAPLDVLMAEGKTLTRLGRLDKLFHPKSQIALPGIIRDQRQANLSGEKTGKMAAGVALTLLGSVINALGGNLGIQASYSQARTATIAFEDVLEDRAEAIDVDRYLGDADVDPFAITSRKLLDADMLYVITAIVKSTKMRITANDASDAALKIDVPVIQQAVGANVNVSASDAAKTDIGYEGKIPLAFGFQAVQLLFQGTTYQRFRVLPAGGGQMKGAKRSRAGKRAKGVGKSVASKATAMLIMPGLVRLSDFE